MRSTCLKVSAVPPARQNFTIALILFYSYDAASSRTRDDTIANVHISTDDETSANTDSDCDMFSSQSQPMFSSPSQPPMTEREIELDLQFEVIYQFF